MRYIAKILNRSPSTISREIYRNTNYYGKYDYVFADKKRKERSWHIHVIIFRLIVNYYNI